MVAIMVLNDERQQASLQNTMIATYPRNRIQPAREGILRFRQLLDEVGGNRHPVTPSLHDCDRIIGSGEHDVQRMTSLWLHQWSGD